MTECRRGRSRLDDAKDRARGRRRPNHTEVRIVQEIIAGAGTGEVRCDANRELRAGGMLSAGILIESAGQLSLSDDVRFSLMLDD